MSEENQDLKLPEFQTVRERIVNTKDQEAKFCFMAEYLFCARISEIVGLKSPSDVTTTARGITGKDVKQSRFKFQNKYFDIIVFTVRTAKRHGKERQIALPIEPKFEPFTEELFNYIIQFGADLVFPFTRQKAWEHAKTVFDGLTYPIETYTISKNKVKQPPVIQHSKPFRTHALRHLRATELLDFYDFNGLELSLYGGWTLRSAMNVGSSIDRYAQLKYKKYLPKLLIPRN